MTFKPTDEQLAIFDKMTTIDKASSIVDAKAGSGKTSTIVAGAEGLPRGSRLVAFNRTIADELSFKTARFGLRASTFHSLGLQIMRERFNGKVKCNNYKYYDLARNLDYGTNVYAYSKIIDTLFTAGIGMTNLKDFDDPDIFIDQFYHQQLQLPEGVSLSEFAHRCQTLIKRGIDTPRILTFSEMLWQPLYQANKHNWNLRDYPAMVVDEAQDVSPVRLALIQATAEQCLAVGDPNQAIYAFAGAMNNALDLIDQSFSCSKLPLSISWRCSNAVIELAQKLIGPYIFASPTALTGSITDIDDKDFFTSDIHDLNFDTAILCRTNSPLFSLAMHMLQKALPFKMLSDYPETLIKLIKTIAKKTNDLTIFNSRLNDWYDDQTEKHSETRKGLLRRCEDQYNCIKSVASQSFDVGDMILNIESMMRSSHGPTLSTIHKAKGLEWSTVYILRPDLLPAPWVEPNTIEYAQEENLEYVAITRSSDRLIYIHD